MGTKEKILALFEENKGIYFSGEDIAEKLSVSRTAVWKAVKSLQSEGYSIDAVRNKGYSLSANTDILSAQGIKKYLTLVCSEIELTVVSTVDSTNVAVREKAASGAAEGYTLLANNQTKGKGRIGRSFFSPADTGIYMSLLLRPHNYSAQQASKLTTMAAVAACEAIEAVSDKKALIKWVNDIFIDGKKVSGILTEASFNLENGFVDYVVLGIGINVYLPKGGFPSELNNIAGAVFNKSVSDGKNHLAAEFLNRFMGYYHSRESSNCAEKYRNRSLVIGKEIQIISKANPTTAVAVDIDDDCRLIVKYEDGKIERLSSGEISVRLT